MLSPQPTLSEISELLHWHRSIARRGVMTQGHIVPKNILPKLDIARVDAGSVVLGIS
jgi:hypothetical protein